MSKKLSNVDLNLLVALDALLTERGVTRAAERLLVGQSAMSSTLARLRRLFDDPLLVRQGRELVATPLAESLVVPVREALSTVESILTMRTSFDPATDHRTFTVTASDYVTLVFLRPLLERLGEEAPNISLNIRTVGEGDYTDQLRRSQTDLLILPRDLLPAEVGYPNSILFSDRYLVAVDAANPDIGDEMTLEQFQKQPYLTYRSGPDRSLADAQLDTQQITRNLEVTTQSFVLAPLLLRGTRLMMLIHEHLAWAMADQLQLRLLEPPMQLNSLRETMVWPAHHTSDPGHEWLRNRLHTLAEEVSSQAEYRRAQYLTSRDAH